MTAFPLKDFHRKGTAIFFIAAACEIWLVNISKFIFYQFTQKLRKNSRYKLSLGI